MGWGFHATLIFTEASFLVLDFFNLDLVFYMTELIFQLENGVLPLKLKRGIKNE